MIETGMNVSVDLSKLEFVYGDDMFGPVTEKRKLNDIRGSLSDPNVEGPETVYAIAMDVGKKKHKEDLIKRNLLYGAMIFEKGIVGEEPVRSQGHIHALSKSCNASTCEVYEIWSGEAYIYMQESASDDAGKCYAVHAKKGEVVIVPPGWVHCTINANPKEPMLFGAWCVRDYGFDYEGVREHKGVAYFPKIQDEAIHFVKNIEYKAGELEIRKARAYPEFNLLQGVSIYMQYENNPDLFAFVTDPKGYEQKWNHLFGKWDD